MNESGIIVGTEAMGVAETGDVLVECVILETISEAKRWLLQAPVTRGVSVFLGSREALQGLMSQGGDAGGTTIDQ